MAIELLTKLAEQQEHCKSILEELALSIRIISFLFLEETDDYSKIIEVNLKYGKKIFLPYLVELVMNLMVESPNS
ncbi:hypothetical protein KBB68_01430 [Candidatus Babeliales bacterium]|nr:hypothetical protein [Candidatus Babeliales bacterium]